MRTPLPISKGRDRGWGGGRGGINLLRFAIIGRNGKNLFEMGCKQEIGGWLEMEEINY